MPVDLAPTYTVCGVELHAATLGRGAEIIVEAAIAGRGLQVHLCNAFTLSLVERDDRLRSSLDAGDLNLPDGAPAAWLGRHQGTRGPVRGPDLVGEVVDRGRARQVSHFFWGAGPGVAELMAERLVEAYPGASVVGTESPPFGPVDDEALEQLADRVRDAGAQVLWIGLGTPRQDHVVPALGELLDVPVVPVGAAFDFWAGTAREAPRWLRGTGLEWVFRLAHEPRRLWHRYSVGHVRFLLGVARDRRR
ncbi:N-acetylglucosaminyldiphosphoundecaprenol N-acetyl-beta-D-mannosaminyltransferase [Nocardioides scoriae]|uniref:N-acetylglucosaminyldiphosphoundecaprenol N-acetyl-beta-D-mannosaminyltransferase n=1 Tax=Nocardioides scoriae TaxID=642780 RepID=A0A1H1WYR7_9ACTN|nr:WecB/TagA/CpsF family glycosyltransferase [Nocardioides scoriae]SDT01910.1 N-acetylglucosaminyldiphosphoundecaprenol N-acetyl-beta-D-mannosaminyltransferase [Nocardioides scoriae]